MVRLVALGILIFTVQGPASALPVSADRLCRVEYIWRVIPHEVCSTPKFASRTVEAPEIDPASALGSLSLLLGGLAVLRGQRNKSATR
jgi:hypothetical protein